MFFISDTEIPFKTVSEALRQPNWKFIFNAGEEAIFVFPAKQVYYLKNVKRLKNYTNTNMNQNKYIKNQGKEWSIYLIFVWNSCFLSKGVPEYVKYWDIVEKNPSKYTFASARDAINHLDETPRVIYVTYNEKISSYYASNQNLPDIKEIKEPSVFYFGYLLPKYSPLTPILSRFGANSFENGLYDRYIILGSFIPNHHIESLLENAPN